MSLMPLENVIIYWTQDDFLENCVYVELQKSKRETRVTEPYDWKIPSVL